MRFLIIKMVGSLALEAGRSFIRVGFTVSKDRPIYEADMSTKNDPPITQTWLMP